MALPTELVLTDREGVMGSRITVRENTVLATCDAGTYVGSTRAGVTQHSSVRLVRGAWPNSESD